MSQEEKDRALTIVCIGIVLSALFALGVRFGVLPPVYFDGAEPNCASDVKCRIYLPGNPPEPAVLKATTGVQA